MAERESLSNPSTPGQSPKPNVGGAGSEVGLSEAEAARRLQQYGQNALAEHHVSILERLAHFFWGPSRG